MNPTTLAPKSALPKTLADVIATLQTNNTLSATRRRDLRSAVNRVATLLACGPSDIELDLGAISARLAAISPLAAGMTAKTLANVRSDFLAAVKATGLMPVTMAAALTPSWANLFRRRTGRRAHIGLTRLARYASARQIEPRQINDEVMANFIADVRQRSLHRNPKKLQRQVTLIWNEVARDPQLGLQPVTVASFRGPPGRIDWSILPMSFRNDVAAYLSWAGRSDPFAVDARARALKPTTLRLRRDQIHAAVSALVESGMDPAKIHSLADLVTLPNFKNILRRRLTMAGGAENLFNRDLGITLTLLAREWVKVDAPVLAELTRLVGKLPVPIAGLTDKNKRFLRQFDDPKALRRLVELPERLWAEVKRETKRNFRTLAKAQAALAIAILTYMPIRLQNLSSLAFDAHIFLRPGLGATSTLELSNGEVKNETELAFDIPPNVARMLIAYRERIAPKFIGHRPTKLFVNMDSTPKSSASVASLISTYSKRRTGIVLSPHQFRHLSAKVVLDDQPGAFESVRQLLGHKRHQTTVNAYAGIDSRRAGRHHQRLIEAAMAPPQKSSPRAG
jgi:integrase